MRGSAGAAVTAPARPAAPAGRAGAVTARFMAGERVWLCRFFS